MFQTFSWTNDVLYDDSNGLFPSTLSSFSDGDFQGGEADTHFGYVLSGLATIICRSGTFSVSEGMYFCVPGNCRIEGKGRGVVITRHDQAGFFQLGGPIEETGRLRYIDGCSDSLLISPTVCGDACLNLLHIPPGTQQTRHTHPSLRAGLIVSGQGTCETPTSSSSLEPGTIFVIPEETEHSFHTTDSELLVIAYHPDSDTGPRHDDHPMVNRTIVNGISANVIPEIRT